SSGMVSIAHGNDGGGSVRAPASFTGLVGLKPSRGRIPGSDGIGAEGALTRTIEDTAAALDFMTGPPTPPFHAPPSYVTTYREAIATPPGRLRIGVTTAMTFPSELTQDAVDAVGTATRLLEGLGHHVSEVPGLPVDPEWFTRTFHKLWAPSGTAGVRFVDESALGVSNQEQLRRARAMNASEYAAAMDEAGAVASAVTRGWGADFDVLVTPTNPFVAPRVGWLTERESEDPWSAIERSAKIATFTAVCNLVGVPAISLPLHQTSDGLPLGVQLIGPPWRDDLLLALAAELEAAEPWRDRTPTTPFRTTGDPS
ncbi:MAG: amidase, partial [Glaciecola sp.]